MYMHNSQLVYNFYDEAINFLSLSFTCFARFFVLLLLYFYTETMRES